MPSSSRINHNGNSIDLSIWSVSAPNTIEFEENNIRKVNFALTIPNPNLDCSYVVLNFWPNLSLFDFCSYKIVLTKKLKRVVSIGQSEVHISGYADVGIF